MVIVDVKKAFANIIEKELSAKFHDEFVFGPIHVQAELDLDGESFLHAYIVFDGDQKKLDPSWTAALPRNLWPCSEELGYPGLPIQSFVKKSEWKNLKKVIL